MIFEDLIAWFNREQQRQYGQSVTIDSPLRTSGHEVTGVYAGLILRSVFQPIFPSDSGFLAGHEALLRATTAQGTPVSPAAVFTLPTSAEEVIFLDRLCRTLHALNFLLQGGEDSGFLGLNIHPRHVEAVRTDHGQAFEQVLHQCGLSPEKVVLEISSRSLQNPNHLVEAVSNYRQRGYRIALDSIRQLPEPDHLRALTPDLIKFDPQVLELSDAKLGLLLSASGSAGAQRIVVGAGRERAQRYGLELAQAESLATPQRLIASGQGRATHGGRHAAQI